MGAAGGVEVRENSIRIQFTFNGVSYKKTLKTGKDPIPPTPGNVKYAIRLAGEIKQKIKFGAFTMADYFPDEGDSGTATTLADRIDIWKKSLPLKKSSTVKGYLVAAGWWEAELGSKPLAGLVYSDILQAIAKRTDWSGKTINNKTSVLRRILHLAIKDGALKNDPMDGLEPAEHQAPDPDPFPIEQVDQIIAEMGKRYGEQMANYFGFKFYTGVRTGESLGLRWDSIDWPSKTASVKEGITMGEHVTTTKTSKVRQVALNSQAMFYLERQKAHTFLMPAGWVFVDPKTQKRWVDDWGPRNTYWEPLLKKMGLRYRSPYQTRHTYATMLLMAGATPAWAARQMGHSIQVFLKTYARWIDGGQNAIEMGKLESLIARSTPAKTSRAA